MIISASRRTDVPAFHAEWMMNRLREGYVCVRNPFNAHQVSRISLAREEAEAIVFWTKNAANMMHCLDELDGMGYRYLFQYTLTPYGQDIEKGVDKKQAMESLIKLSGRLGKEGVIWRYDPILLGGEWTVERHIRLFEKMCARLEGATDRCVVSFVDLYASVKRNAAWIKAPDEVGMHEMAREISGIARAHGMVPSACAETVDMTGDGLEARGCIDRLDMERLLDGPVRAQKDAGQRGACRCVRSVDIGAYDTCGHGCVYCYARTGRKTPGICGVNSPVLGGVIGENDRIIERAEKRISGIQTSFID